MLTAFPSSAATDQKYMLELILEEGLFEKGAEI